MESKYNVCKQKVKKKFGGKDKKGGGVIPYHECMCAWVGKIISSLSIVN